LQGPTCSQSNCSNPATSQPQSLLMSLHACLSLLLAYLVLVHAQSGDAADRQGSPGWSPAAAEDLALAGSIDVSKRPSTCKPSIINKIDWGVATAAYQASKGVVGGLLMCCCVKVYCCRQLTTVAAASAAACCCHRLREQSTKAAKAPPYGERSSTWLSKVQGRAPVDDC
jgi:hypothetical protein